MKPLTLWIIRVALAVQFLGVLSVPALLASAESPSAAQRAKQEAAAVIERAKEMAVAHAR